MSRIKLLILTLGGVVTIAVVLGLGLAGVFDSDDSPGQIIRESGPTGDAAETESIGGPASEPVGPGQLEPAGAKPSESSDTGVPDGGEAVLSSPTGAPASDDPQVPPSTPQPQAEAFVPIEPDPNYKEALQNARISTFIWETDFSRHTVPYSEIMSGGVPRDGIPPIDFPRFATLEETDEWLRDPEPVIAFELNGDARAYPLRILTSHEIVNDVVGDVPVVITFCPLCNTAIVFERTLEGAVHDFGVSGNLRKSDLIMWDRQTQTWWQQITGKGIVGSLAGMQLKFLNAPIVSWEDFKAANPDGVALSRQTGFGRSYARTPYAGYDRADNPPFLYDGVVDGRLLPKERVAAIAIGDVDAAFPFSVLEKEGAVNHTVNGQDLTVFFRPGAVSVFDNLLTGEPDEVGATGVFDANLDGRKLTFRAEGDGFVDDETGSVWNILGEAVDGPLAGRKLTPIVHANHFWFAWGAFKPDTLIYTGAAIAEARSGADDA